MGFVTCGGVVVWGSMLASVIGQYNCFKFARAFNIIVSNFDLIQIKFARAFNIIVSNFDLIQIKFARAFNIIVSNFDLIQIKFVRAFNIYFFSNFDCNQIRASLQYIFFSNFDLIQIKCLFFRWHLLLNVIENKPIQVDPS